MANLTRVTKGINVSFALPSYVPFILWFVLGLALIVYGGEGFVKASVQLADIFSIPRLYIGTFLIGFCTSLPEIFVTYLAAQNGSFELSVGNVLGSYICNIGFVIGLTAVIKPLKVNSDTLTYGIPLLALSIMVTALLLMLDSKFNQLDGVILLCLFIGYLYLCYCHINQNRSQFTSHKTKTFPHNTLKSSGSFVLFLALLLLGSELLVDSASNLATALHIDELTIGLTIVAIGTSLPELTACIIAGLSDEDDIAIGNVIGSNIFCLLCVLPIPLLMAPSGGISPEKLWVPMCMMLLVTTVLWVFSAKFDKVCQISRFEGFLLCLITAGYLLSSSWLHLI